MTAIAAVAAQGIQIIPLVELEISPLNPRKTYDSAVYDSAVYDSAVYDSAVYDSAVYDSAVIEELAESIRLHGVINPLLVREVPIEGYIVRLEIIAGSRRFFALEKAAKLVAPCIVRQMTDGWKGDEERASKMASLTQADAIRIALVALEANELTVHEYDIGRESNKDKERIGLETVASLIGLDAAKVRAQFEPEAPKKMPAAKPAAKKAAAKKPAAKSGPKKAVRA